MILFALLVAHRVNSNIVAHRVTSSIFLAVAQKFIVLYNEKVRVEIIVELRKGQTEDESGYFIIRYRGI